MAPKINMWIALATAVLTVLAFGVSITTLPLSGPFCAEGCFHYPYLDVGARWPADYFWMIFAALVPLSLVFLIGAVHEAGTPGQRQCSRLALTFAAMGTAVILIAYFVQLSVIQPALLAGERDGVAMLTQFNPHGAFIALEELGYLLLAGALTLVAFAPYGRGAAGRVVRLALGIALPLSLATFATMIAIYGPNREYRFEVAVLSIFWICVLIGSTALAFWFSGHRTSDR